MSRILIRRNTTTQWSSGNPVLAAGELGYDTVTGQVKVGNGTTPWNSLPAINSSPGNFFDTTGAMVYATNSTQVPNGYTTPGIYVRNPNGSWQLFRGLQPGLPYKTITPSGSGSPAKWNSVTTWVMSSSGSSTSKTGVNISAGKVLVVAGVGIDTNAQSIQTPQHSACSNWQLHVNNIVATGSSRQLKLALFEGNSSGGTDTMVVPFTGTNWTANVHVFHNNTSNIGSFLGFTSQTATNNASISVQRNDANAKVALSTLLAFTVNANMTVQASQWSSNLVVTSPTVYDRMASTSEAGNINNVQQTFSLQNGSNFSVALALMAQWAGPTNQANYTVTNEDLGTKLIFESGTPTLTLPSGLASYSDMEEGLVVEVQPNTTLTLLRGSGATFWASVGSGNVASAVVTCNSSQKKIITLSVRNGSNWTVVGGEVD